ncbi:MAG: hypothetical protein FK730_07340 [Asgard group archaeon]|nr:hypothetical protein [Asgard group archaeon]
MSLEEFKKKLKQNNVQDKQIEAFILEIDKYQKYLEKENLTLETVDPKKLVEYTEYLVSIECETVLNFLIALWNYANFTKKREFITEVIDLLESYNAMDNLYTRIAEIHGEKIRDEIFNGLTIPPIGVHPEKKPEFTKIIMKRTEEKLGEEKIIELLKPCLHGRPPDDIEHDRKLYQEKGIDALLEFKHQQYLESMEKHRDEGTYAFAQPIDDEVLEFVKSIPIISAGKREGNIIYVAKTPYQAKKYLNTDDENLKRFYCCYCPWVRGALKDGTDNEITKNFCQCSGGWFKLYWDQIFEQPIVVEPVATPLTGALECKFAIYLPDDVIIKEKKEG